MRYATCHPDKKHCVRGLCNPCYQRRKYRQKRRSGLPAWLAASRSAEGWVKLTANDHRWRQSHPERARAKYNRRDQRYRERFGGNISEKWSARLKWMEAKAMTRKNKWKRKPKGKGKRRS